MILNTFTMRRHGGGEGERGVWYGMARRRHKKIKLKPAAQNHRNLKRECERCKKEEHIKKKQVEVLPAIGEGLTVSMASARISEHKGLKRQESGDDNTYNRQLPRLVALVA